MKMQKVLWAIDTRNTHFLPFLGSAWHPHEGQCVATLDPIRILLFPTREDARSACKVVREKFGKTFPHPRPVRVVVTIESVQ